MLNHLLVQEVVNDELGRNYSVMSPSELMNSLNDVNRPVAVKAKDVRRYLLLVGRWPGIADAATHQATASIRQSALNVVDTLANFDDFDLQDPAVLAAVSAGLDSLISFNLMNETDKAAILSLGDNKQSRGEEIGFGIVRLSDVAGLT